MFVRCYFGVYLLFLLGICLGDNTVIEQNGKWQILCPALYPRVFTSYIPQDNLTAGVFTLKKDVNSIKQCIATCCTSRQCNVILMYDSSCYHVQCSDSKMCIPMHRPELAGANPLRMVLVKPVKEGKWYDLLEFIDNDQKHLSCLKTTDCNKNEVCLLTRNAKSEIGKCECMVGYKRSKVGICQVKRQEGDEVINDKTSSANLPTLAKPSTKILVTALSKEVRLPENEVSLSAVTIPEESETDHYNYAWTLLSQPEGHNGIMTDQNRKTVKLSNLSKGLYQFKVTVNGPHNNGEAFANVSVLPPKRIAKARITITTLPMQNFKLPNTGAVLDDLPRKHDNKIISYRVDKKIGRNHTIIKWTVEDSDHVSNFTVANVTV